MKKLFLAGSAALLALPAYSAGPDHLVLSEIAQRGGSYDSAHESSEYVEIYNPTGSDVNDLQNYYVTDWAEYYSLPTATRDSALPDLGTGDFLARFPDSSSIPSGGVVVVTSNGQYFLDAFFGSSLAAFESQPNSPKLYEMFDSSVEIDNMVSLNTEPTNNATNLSHSDAGENQFLFYWDGITDLVQDVDMMMYNEVAGDLGYTNGITVKTGLEADGPDGDLVTGTYATDAGSTANLTAWFQAGASADRPYQFARRSLIEVGETSTGGNGITGHDETLEEINATWGGQAETTATATPGVTSLGLSSADQPPVIYNSYRVEAFPQAGETINFGAFLTDDGSIGSGILNVDIGLGYAPVAMVHSGPGDLWTATIVAPADGSEVKWYVSATDNSAQTRSENDYQHFYRDYPGYHSFIVGAVDIPDGAIQITEINYDTVGGDNHGESEFIEVHNTTASPIDISGYYFSKRPDDVYWQVTMPEGTIVPADGYLVMAAWKPVFLICYPGFDPAQVVDLSWQRSSALGNTADSVSLVHPNEFGINGQPSVPLDSFSYSGMSAGSGAGNTGYTFELKDVDGPNDDQANWEVSLTLAGTPGRRNSHDNPGNMLIANHTRTVQYPTSADPVVITTDVTGDNAFTVNLHYTTAPGLSYTVVAMTPNGGSQYQADLGTAANGTLFKYFVEATDSAGQTITHPPFAAPFTFFVDDNPPTEQELLITEIMSDPANAENVDHSEWIEIHNTRSEPIDLSFFKIGHNTGSSAYPRVLPEGTVIAGKGYLVFAGNKPVFMQDFPAVDPEVVFDALYAGSIIANGGGTAYITHANSLNWNEMTWQGSGTVLDLVPYDEAANGWPDTSGNFTRELLDITADNSLGVNWAESLVSGGTPAAPGQTSSVNNWSIY